MKWAITAAVLVVAVSGCTERETLTMKGDVPVTVAVSGEQVCVEVGDEGDQGRWCAPPDRPNAVWVGATSVADGLVVAGQAPAEVVSVTLTREGETTKLEVVQSEVGPFFVGVDIAPGDYEISALTSNSEYVSGDVSMRDRSTTSAVLAP